VCLASWCDASLGFALGACVEQQYVGVLAGARRRGRVASAPLETLLVERKLADSNIHREAVKEKGHSEGEGSQI
jgi:hypothetical protein